jgi:ABC-2 type transport system ATP-binding protein
MPTNHPVVISGLSKTFRGFFGKKTLAIRDVSFSVEPGQVVGLIGRNGAGKTTTLKILMGFLRPTGGTSMIFGVPSENPAARRGLGFVPENAALYDFLTPLESMGYALSAHGFQVDSRRAYSLQWLEKLGIADAAKRPIRFLSKGMTQRLALAQALAIQPKALILDEPLSGLDPGGRMDVVEALQEYRLNGGAILFSSHVLYDVERLADRFVMIESGEVRADMDMKSIEAQSARFRVRSAGDENPEILRPDGSGAWIGEVDRSALESTLSELIRLHHQIIEVRPVMNLEMIYLDIARRSP